MKIGIIGAGHIGGTLAGRFRELGYDVIVANSRGPQTLGDLAARTGATPGTVAEAANADVVVVAIPLRAVPDLPAGVFDGRIVVDANNYYAQRDGQIAAIDEGTTSSRWVADHLAGAHVVKAFNNVYAGHLGAGGKPAGTPGRIALPAAGDDPGAKKTVLGLIDELGFDPVDGGPLDESWRQEPGSPVYGTDRDAAGVREGLADAVR